jgi:hypothetical protein
MLPYGGNIYVNYYSLNYEYPSNYENWTDPLFLRTGEKGIHYIDVKGSPYMAVFNRSRCDYTAGVLALAGDGRVLWQRSTGAYVTGMAANNSTIYYGTGNGGLSATSAGVATGLAILASALTGAVFGFLWWTAQPARIFMGDTGSLALGGAMAGLSIVSRTEVLAALIGGLFVIVMLSVVLQVAGFKMTHKRLFKMAPLHHHFEQLGWTEVTIVTRFWLIAGLFTAAGMGLFYAEWVGTQL